MNRHHLSSSLNGHPVLVVVGRPTTRELLIHQSKDDGEEPLYWSSCDPSRDWADPSTILTKLAEFQVPVPASMLPALAEDQPTGNQFVFHYFDRSPRVTAF